MAGNVDMGAILGQQLIQVEIYKYFPDLIYKKR